jgi:1,4-dihydroxy-2-naphthoate octaprenyltransferase
MILSRNTLLHLRIPFSFYLMPVFLFALSVSDSMPDMGQVLVVFLSLHLFIYPASNAYNSYYDKDEKSIGGLRVPPPVSKQLLYTALLFDALGIALGLLIDGWFALGLLLYGLVSKAYSHPAIRLKKYPFLSLFTIAVFQGAFVFLLCSYGMHRTALPGLMQANLLWPACLSSAMLLGSYPMTQIYQHEEDARRGDRTLSRLLGLQGTFVYTGLVFGLVTVAFFYYYLTFYSIRSAVMFVVFLFPVLIFFTNWFRKVRMSTDNASFVYAMRLNTISSVSLNAFYLVFWLMQLQR